MLQKLLLFLTILSWIYWLVAWWMVYDFFRPQTDSTASKRRGPGEAAGRNCSPKPPVSILKPVRGLDWEAYENFASFCRQDYPEFELLFGVADPADPAIPLVERLKREFPQRRIRLIRADAFGANRKASLLHHLAGQACHDILVVSDSDMRVTPDYLQRVVAPLADAQIGLVTCPYRAHDALTLTARLEALHMGVTFLPSVMVARRFLAMRFAMGATMALRRGDLDRIGGFAAVAQHLADDYQLAVRIAGLGRRVALSSYIVVSVLGATTLRDQWEREVRWARCNRVNRPAEYPGLLLSFSVPLSVILLLASGFATIGWQALAASLLVRWVVGWSVTGSTGDGEARRALLWLPVRDLLSALVWVVGGVGRHVAWRGEEFLVQDDGRMEPVLPVAGRPAWRS